MNTEALSPNPKRLRGVLAWIASVFVSSIVVGILLQSVSAFAAALAYGTVVSAPIAAIAVPLSRHFNWKRPFADMVWGFLSGLSVLAFLFALAFLVMGDDVFVAQPYGDVPTPSFTHWLLLLFPATSVAGIGGGLTYWAIACREITAISARG